MAACNGLPRSGIDTRAKRARLRYAGAVLVLALVALYLISCRMSGLDLSIDQFDVVPGIVGSNTPVLVPLP